MEKHELIEKVEHLEEEYLRLQSRYKQLRRRQYLHRGDITGEQADQMRTLLSGHLIDASKAVDFDPAAYVTPSESVDVGLLLWWLDTARGKWLG